jgi:hypothetical protein
MPDADASSTAIGDGEHYWLYLCAETAKQVHKIVRTQAARQLRHAEGPLALLVLLEQGQKLVLQTTPGERKEVRLLGCNAHAMAPFLRQALPEASIETGATKCVRVNQEQLTIRIPILAMLISEPLEKRVRELLAGRAGSRKEAGILPRMDLPKNTLLPTGSELPCFPRADAYWLLREEGPLARYAGPPAPGWEDAYRCPANTLAVEGPRSQLVCVLNYAIEQGAAPIIVQAEELPPPQYRLNFATPARAAAAAWSGSGGLNGCCYKREQARRNYYGIWDIEESEIADDASEEEKAAQEAERILKEECLASWHERNVRNQFEGKLCMVPPSLLEIRVRLRPHCGPIVEYEDFRTVASAEEIFCAQGPVGAGREQLWNPAFPTPEKPQGWIRSAAPELSYNVLVLCLPGAAFPRAEGREAVEALLKQSTLMRLETSPTLMRKLHLSAFKAKRNHVHPTPLPDMRGEDAVEGVTPIPFCPSLHPQLMKIASADELKICDIEDWIRNLSASALPCCLCHRGDVPECQARINAVVPGLITVRASTRDRWIAIFPSVCRPRAARCVHLTPLRESLPAVTDTTRSLAITLPQRAEPAAVARQVQEGYTPSQWQSVGTARLLAQLALYPIAEEALVAQEGISKLAAFLIHTHHEIDDKDLLKAVPLARSTRSLVSLVDAGSTLLQSDNGNLETNPLLTQLQALRAASPAWHFGLVFKLAALVDSESDVDGLAHLLQALNADNTVEDVRKMEENAQAISLWLDKPDLKDFYLAGLRRLNHHFLLGNFQEIKKKRDDFTIALSYQRKDHPSVTDLRRRVRFLLAERGPSDQILSAHKSAWGPNSLRLWWQRTLDWDEHQAAELITTTSEANLAACSVLGLLEHNTELEAFNAALKALREGRQELAHHVDAPTSVSASERARLQFTLPRAGEQRLHDAQEQPEHQALFLAHALRELVSTWAALATDTENLELEGAELPAVIRGDPEYLAAERQRCQPLPNRGEHGGLLDDAELRDILICGSASLSASTGGCVPRRALWRHPAETQLDDMD